MSADRNELTDRRIKDLGERVEKLVEDEANRRHAAFAAHWFALSEADRQLVGEVLDEFEALWNSGQVLTEADCETYTEIGF
jgi:hypothetical protein